MAKLVDSAEAIWAQLIGYAGRIFRILLSPRRAARWAEPEPAVAGFVALSAAALMVLEFLDFRSFPAIVQVSTGQWEILLGTANDRAHFQLAKTALTMLSVVDYVWETAMATLLLVVVGRSFARRLAQRATIRRLLMRLAPAVVGSWVWVVVFQRLSAFTANDEAIGRVLFLILGLPLLLLWIYARLIPAVALAGAARLPLWKAAASYLVTCALSAVIVTYAPALAAPTEYVVKEPDASSRVGALVESAQAKVAAARRVMEDTTENLTQRVARARTQAKAADADLQRALRQDPGSLAAALARTMLLAATFNFDVANDVGRTTRPLPASPPSSGPGGVSRAALRDEGRRRAAGEGTPPSHDSLVAALDRVTEDYGAVPSVQLFAGDIFQYVGECDRAWVAFRAALDNERTLPAERLNAAAHLACIEGSTSAPYITRTLNIWTARTQWGAAVAVLRDKLARQGVSAGADALLLLRGSGEYGGALAIPPEGFFWRPDTTGCRCAGKVPDRHRQGI